jgi:hypothetical protein
VKILFLLLHPGYIRNYESVIRGLADRGHQVRLAFSALSKKKLEDRQADALAASDPRIVIVNEVLPKRADVWKVFARYVRGGTDYLRYYHADYAGAKMLRERIELEREAKVWRPFFRCVMALAGGRGFRAMSGLFRYLESVIPPCPQATAFLAAEAPDLLFVSPLVNYGSSQTDYFKAAQSLGIPHALGVTSWDNLTNKGLARVQPLRVFVWNRLQKEEAVKYHGIDPARVVVTGAQCYDKWFDQKPSSSRETFCQRVGLDPDRPFVLYVCSSPFIAREEAAFVESWVRRLRAEETPPGVRTLGVLVRPHPQNASQWKAVDLSSYGNVVIHPREGANPVTQEAREDFYDAMHHCAAVVGINSSAMIEAGILDKPVLTVRAPEFTHTQDGTLHFHHISKGGLLSAAENLDQHVGQLEAAVNASPASTAGRRDFIQSFIRPHGLTTPCTAIFLDALEEMLAHPSPLDEPRPPALLVRAFGVWAAAMNFSSSAARWFGDWAVPVKGASFPGRVLSLLVGFFWKLATLFRVARPLERRLLAHFSSASVGSIDEEDTLRRIRQMVKSGAPVVVGPWLSEVGFELQYWIPFLQWVNENMNLPRERVIALSRGGVASWYSCVADRYVEIFDHFDARSFRDKNFSRMREAGGQKHSGVSTFDQEIVRSAQARGELPAEFAWLHPSLMFRLFKPYWTRNASVSLIERYTKYKPMSAPVAPDFGASPLSGPYVAAKFYYSEAFPDVPENREFVRRMLFALSSRSEVVLLNTGLEVDDHRDSLPSELSFRVHSAEKFLSLRDNLGVQTALISGAQAFYGTYGGFSYLAPFYGVPSVSFYSREDKFLPVHLDVAHRSCRVMKYGYFDKVKAPLWDRNGHKKANFLAMSTVSWAALEAVLGADSPLEFSMGRDNDLRA